MLLLQPEYPSMPYNHAAMPRSSPAAAGTSLTISFLPLPFSGTSNATALERQQSY